MTDQRSPAEGGARRGFVTALGATIGLAAILGVTLRSEDLLPRRVAAPEPSPQSSGHGAVPSAIPTEPRRDQLRRPPAAASLDEALSALQSAVAPCFHVALSDDQPRSMRVRFSAVVRDGHGGFSAVQHVSGRYGDPAVERCVLRRAAAALWEAEGSAGEVVGLADLAAPRPRDPFAPPTQSTGWKDFAERP